jgi:hypothetical protein
MAMEGKAQPAESRYPQQAARALRACYRAAGARAIATASDRPLR